MGRKSRVKLVIRSIILLITIILTLISPNALAKFMAFSIVGNFKIYNLFWIYLMYEMIIVFIPKWNNYTYCGKLYERHYRGSNNYNKEKLINFTKKNSVRALRAAAFWIVLNSIIAYIYFKLNLSVIFMYLLFLFYYWSDMFCVNVWCPFHKRIVRNKCCNECRIYNWGHIMYLTPLIFIKSFWSYSLVIMGVILFIQWEYLNYKHPERFSPISNENLRCGVCTNDCRYNKNKKNKLEREKT